ncbi:MAG TPA: hypothetical protein VI911_11015 [Patescibacteria group bacterium]|nr:hypothetical protein [Patescibacteria group bacterium]
MADLTFTNQGLRAQSLRAAPSKYAKSKLRYNFEQSEGQRLAEVFYPWKYLPVQFQDIATEDFVVIPKGKIVSAIGYGDYVGAMEATAAATSGILANPHASGSIPVFSNRAGTVVTANMDSDFWGYNESVCSLLVPANGGQDRTTANLYEYTANDVTAGTYRAGNVLAADGDDVAGPGCSGNIPIGVAMYDIYQDIRGKNLNYQQWDKWGTLSDFYVTVPFIREGFGGTTFNKGLSAFDHADDVASISALRNMTFLTIPSGTYARTGCTIAPDIRGNYVIEHTNAVLSDVAGVSGAANPTIQTVGRLITLDTRFPKDLLQYVDTYEGSQMAGTDTGGLPYWLFIFAYNYLTAATGSAPAISSIVDYVKSGRFGMARIQLHIN